MFDKNSKNPDKELSAGLLRQRRNLILISLIMPLFFLSGASVNKINMFGTVINLESQSGINIVLFVIYFYFLWRYLQYYLVEERAKEFRLQRDDKIYQIEFDLLKGLMLIKAKCFDFEHYYPSFKAEKSSSFHTNRVLPNSKLDKKISLFNKARVMEISGLPNKYENHYLKSGNDYVELPHNETKEIEKQWRLVSKKAGDSRYSAIFETDVKYNTLYLKWLRFKGYFNFYIVHPYFSDYELPFLIAATSFVVTIVYV